MIYFCVLAGWCGKRKTHALALLLLPRPSRAKQVKCFAAAAVVVVWAYACVFF